jgi:NADPH2:quinone reductase
MKTLLVRGYGPEDRILLEEAPLPHPAAGQVRIKVHACGISFVDLLLARGGYQVRPPTPFVPGSEFSGVVDAMGEGTDGRLTPGDRVCGTRMGAWSEYICVPQALAFALPPQADLIEASVLLAPYLTSIYALRSRALLSPGETLLVLGATGSVGHAAVQLGKILGARVIAAASTDAKRAAAMSAGADAVVDTTGDWKAAVKALAGPGGVDVVYDPVGGGATDTAFRTLAWGGRHLMVGFAGGEIGALKSNLSIVKGASLVGVDARQAGERTPALMHERRTEVLALYAQGRIRPLVSHVLPVERFDEAAARMNDRAGFGRVVFTFQDGGQQGA